MSSNTNNSAIPPARSLPKDALIIQTMLQEMGVTNYEPQVINQLLEFQYRYVSDILDDAKIFSQHANKKVIDSDDIKLAVQCKLDHSFTNPPPRDVLMDLARHKNSTPLPLIKPFTGTRLPPDRYCLINTNFRLASKKVHRPTLSFGGGGLGGMLGGGGGGGGGGRMRFNISQPSVARSTSVSGGSVIPKPLMTPMFAIKPGTAASTPSARPMPTIRLTAGPSLGGSTGSTGLPTASGSTTTDHPLTSFTSQLSADPGGMMGGALKRKRDEDDDYDDLNNL